MVIFFDVIGTVFSLERARHRFLENELGREIFDLWFARLLQAGMAATLAGRFIPLRQVAEATLKQVVPMSNGGEEIYARTLKGLEELEPWPEALHCLRTLREQDHRVCALTNGETQGTEALLKKAGVRDLFQSVISAEDAGAWKPHPKPYLLALERCGVTAGEACLVAAHGWDVMGAAAVGMRTVWVSSLERRWPFPGEAPGLTVATLAEVPHAVGFLQ